MGNAEEDTNPVRKGGRMLLGAGDSRLEQEVLRGMNQAEERETLQALAPTCPEETRVPLPLP